MHSAASPDLHPDETRFVEMVFPEQANHYGTLFGGHALSLMGKAAFVSATRHARAGSQSGHGSSSSPSRWAAWRA
mgnify:CR=1 FL=1